MKKRDINQVLAKNLKEAMERKFDGEVNQSELARQSGVSQKTISNILSTLRPELADLNVAPSPTVTKLSLLAKALDMDLWELLHPEPTKVKALEIASGKEHKVDIAEVAELMTIYASSSDEAKRFILNAARQRFKSDSIGSPATSKTGSKSTKD
jgi:transcriptional regulator with XRE-family HTH domain